MGETSAFFVMEVTMFQPIYSPNPGNRAFNRILQAFFILALLCAPFATPARVSASPDPAKCMRFYVVAKGERLSQLSSRYGLSPQALAGANGLSTTTPLPHGYVLCIPYKPLDWYFPQAALYASISFNRITVWGSGFPKEHRFNIRIKAYLGSKTKKVGNVLISEDGEFEAFPRIPKDFEKARTLEVCLKDNNDSYRLCTRVSR